MNNFFSIKKKVSKKRLHPQGQRPRGYLLFIPSGTGKQAMSTQGKGLNNVNSDILGIL